MDNRSNKKKILSVKPGTFTLLSTAILPLFASSGLIADNQFGLALEAGVRYEDNIIRVNNSEQSDVTRFFGGAVSYKTLGKNHSLQLDYRLLYEDFVQDAQEDGLNADGQANFKVQLIPSRVDFFIEQQASSQTVDSSVANTPDNTEQRLITRSGFNFKVKLSNRDILNISPSYSVLRFDETNAADSDRSNIEAQWLHQISKVSSFRVRGNWINSTFDGDSDSDDFDQQDITLEYTTQLSRLSYSIAVGNTSIQRGPLNDTDGIDATVNLAYQEDSSTYGASFISRLTDSSIGLSNLENTLINFDSIDNNASFVDILRRNDIQVFWQKQFGELSNLRVSGTISQQNYETQPIDQEQRRILVEYTKKINNKFDIRPSLAFSSIEFKEEPIGPRTNEEYDLAFDIGYRLNRNLQLSLQLNAESRNSNRTNIDDFENYGAAFRINYLVR